MDCSAPRSLALLGTHLAGIFALCCPSKTFNLSCSSENIVHIHQYRTSGLIQFSCLSVNPSHVTITPRDYLLTNPPVLNKVVALSNLLPVASAFKYCTLISQRVPLDLLNHRWYSIHIDCRFIKAETTQMTQNYKT